MSEKIFYSKSDVRRRLKIGRIRYEQLVESGILPPPMVLTDGARPVHTQAHIQTAENNLLRRATNSLMPRTGRRKTKPLSSKLIGELK